MICQHHQKTTTQKLDYTKTITMAANQVSTLHKGMPKRMKEQKAATATHKHEKYQKSVKRASDHHITMLQITVVPQKYKACTHETPHNRKTKSKTNQRRVQNIWMICLKSVASFIFYTPYSSINSVV